jgi:hypothetical protein
MKIYFLCFFYQIKKRKNIYQKIRWYQLPFYPLLWGQKQKKRIIFFFWTLTVCPKQKSNWVFCTKTIVFVLKKHFLFNKKMSAKLYVFKNCGFCFCIYYSDFLHNKYENEFWKNNFQVLTIEFEKIFSTGRFIDQFEYWDTNRKETISAKRSNRWLFCSVK